MDYAKAKDLLDTERIRVEGPLAQMEQAGRDDRTAADQDGDMFDSAEPLTREGTDESIQIELQDRLAAVGRAEQRLEKTGRTASRFAAAAHSRRPAQSGSHRRTDVGRSAAAT